MAKFEKTGDPTTKSSCWIATQGDFFETDDDQVRFCVTNEVFCRAFCKATHFNLI